MKNLSEKKLVILLKKRNVHAFNELYARYRKEVYACAYKRIGSKDDVQDIIQDLFISIWNNPDNIDEDKPLRPYLFKSLKFKIIDCYYKKNKLPVTGCDFQETKYDHGAETHDNVLIKELETVLNDGISKLPIKMKEVFLLSRREHLSNEKISERLSISSQTVKNHISLALKKLKCAVEDYNTL